MLLDLSINFTSSEAGIVADIIHQEIYKRTLVKWHINKPGAEFTVQLVFDANIDLEETYKIDHDGTKCFTITGKTKRALLYGGGKFMRCLELGYEQTYSTPYTPLVRLHSEIAFPIVSTPRYVWRGHQIAYRPKTHSYDAASVEVMKQEILDQVLHGASVIEMIPPRLDDCQQSPHFIDPWTDRLTSMTSWCDLLGVKVSLWYPTFPGADWHETYRSMKRYDMLFVPGGDPGGRDPDELFSIVRDHVAVARSYFPDIEVWVSSQFGLSVSPDFSLEPWAPKEKLEKFYRAVEANQDVLTGVVYGPWTADTSEEFRKRIPARLPVRDYPDLCHNLRSQYPVGPRWDFAFAATYNRETINPRPVFYTKAFHHEMPHCDYGSGCYSEGCGDDVNKHVWSALLWDPSCDVTTIMDDYARWYIGHPDAASLILDLEQNWAKPLKSGFVLETLKTTLTLLAKLPTRIERNWRWQMIFFRAVCDAFLYIRQYGDPSNRSLAWSVKGGSSVPWITHFEKKNKEVEYFVPSEMALFGRLQASAGVLYALAGMQLDVSRFGNMHEERGGHLELLQALPPDDGIPKGKFTVLRLDEVPTTGYSGPILDHADTCNSKVVETIKSLPTRWLSFYTCIWPSALPLEIETDAPSDPALKLEIVYIGEDLMLEGGDYEELYRCALPVRCTCNGELLHDFQAVEKHTGPKKYSIPAASRGNRIKLVWDVEDRKKVTIRCIPVPVADVRFTAE